MKILYVRPAAGEAEIVEASLAEHDCVFVESLDEVEAAAGAEVEALSVFVDTPVPADILERLPSLKFIATRSTGYDHVAVKELSKHDVAVSHVPHYGQETVAEYAFALMFALSRKVGRAYQDLRASADLDKLEPYEGFTLSGKTIGIVGTGAIGRQVAAIANGFGMSTLAYDVSPDEAWATTLSVTYTNLEELLGSADIVTLHVPSLPTTHHLVNAERLALMKPSAYLINTARGDIVDTEALVAALKASQLAGAGLDVLEGERELRDELELLVEGNQDQDLWRTLVAGHVLIDLPNVIVTPHIAFNTKEAKREIIDTTLANLKAYIAGRPQNTVHP